MNRSILPLGCFLWGLGFLATTQAQQAPNLPPPPLDAVLRVKVDNKMVVFCQFDLPGKADQSFQNVEYKYAVLDQEGLLVPGAFKVFLPLRTIELPKDRRSVTDRTDAMVVAENLKKGEVYHFVVSVRNLTGFGRFKIE